MTLLRLHVRRLMKCHMQLPEEIPKEEVELAPGQAVQPRQHRDKYPQIKTHFIPRHVRGPLEKATRYWSRWPLSLPSHRSGINACGCGKTVGLKWTKVAPIATTAYAEVTINI